MSRMDDNLLLRMELVEGLTRMERIIKRYRIRSIDIEIER